MDTRNRSADFRNDRLLSLLTERKYRIYRHLSLIAFMAAVLFTEKKPHDEVPHELLRFVAFFVLICLFYFNMYWMLPKLIFRHRYFAYLSWVLLLLGITLAVFIMMRSYVKPTHGNSGEEMDVSTLLPVAFMFCILLGASSAIKLFQRSIAVSKRVSELEHATIQSELEQLKNQINPHFLLNMLNNANVLTVKAPDKASQLLIKLSDLLRYQLYDSARQRVLLTADIHFLEDFLNLEKTRRDHFTFDIETLGELNGVQVSPLLFIVFVENAVKHSLDADHPSSVRVTFGVKDNVVAFSCENTKPFYENRTVMKGGLGLTNVRRRLELLYPGQYSLITSDEANGFRVDLTLTL
ncbi:histidine kinase [Mucilaginibacter yixingensis]|uniref:Histidine kinase n=1 Tax=Mucilaginibacter yixingensis TaxID=1295612 RepID=A0A2T5J9C5_9SPHI|nr:histidine kinase [Mucilaginibacter yixingensis]PTQ96609.1 histidine kinase [Mucilaginibacter yixingensis]